ncbi:MAG: SRPBCC family protein [Actinomycetota bacterium]
MVVEVRREIHASAEMVWGVVSDITRMGEWSAETYRCEWNEGQSPGLGATFTGYNRYGEVEWSNQATICEWVPGERLAWEVRVTGRAAERFGSGPLTRWGFAIEGGGSGGDTGDDTVVLVQTAEDMRPDDLKAYGAKLLPEIADRVKRNTETMEATLAAIAEECGRSTGAE